MVDRAGFEPATFHILGMSCQADDLVATHFRKSHSYQPDLPAQDISCFV